MWADLPRHRILALASCVLRTLVEQGSADDRQRKDPGEQSTLLFDPRRATAPLWSVVVCVCACAGARPARGNTRRVAQQLTLTHAQARPVLLGHPALDASHSDDWIWGRAFGGWRVASAGFLPQHVFRRLATIPQLHESFVVRISA